MSDRMSDFEVGLLGDELRKSASPAENHGVGFVEPVNLLFVQTASASDDVVFIKKRRKLDDGASFRVLTECQVGFLTASSHDLHQTLFFLKALRLRHLDQTSRCDLNFLICEFECWQARSLPQCSDESDDVRHASGDLSKSIPT